MHDSLQDPFPRFSPSPRGEVDGFPGCDPITENEILEKNRPWRLALEEAAGKTFLEYASNLFESKGLGNLDEPLFEKSLNEKLIDLRQSAWLGRWSHTDKTQAEKRAMFKDLSAKTCTEIALEPNREDLLAWVNRKGKGKALFVDCPMGVGKTYSIVKALGKNRKLSALIFMPTNRLCEQMVQDLKSEIIRNYPNLMLDYMDIAHDEEVVDEDGNVLTDDIAGAPIFRWTRGFLEKEVYFADGINQGDCRHFDEIVKRYRQNWITKQDVCKKCEKEPECRFVSHWKIAPLSRIVVTTHAQYDHFYQQSGIRKWFKHGYDRQEEVVPRNVFIVDEDLVLSKCYQPIYLDRKEIGDFIATLIDFLSCLKNRQTLQITQTRQTIQTLQPTHPPKVIEKLEKQEDQQVRDLKAIQKIPLAEIESKIHKLFSQSNMPRKTSLVPPVDRDFKFATVIKRKWNEIFPDQASIIPEYLDRSEIVGNHLELIESGLRLGVTVQRFGRRDRIYFPNTKAYDLSRLPPHVFFDGTMVDDKFLENKFKNVKKFEPMNIDIKPLWQLRVRQNKTTDLPKKTAEDDQHKVEQLLRKLLGELGTSHKYFFLTKKKIRETYLKSYLEELKNEYPDFDYVLEHFGNLRGINEASDCDIGIMLGSYNPSDAVEIAMALEFIQDKLPNKIIPTENNLWKWRDTNTRRRYEPEYSEIEEMAKALRQTEHRQGIARTRYLFHDVDFYIVSKDPVSDYEPFATVDPKPYAYDIFPPRPRRPESIYEKVKNTALRLLKEHDSVTVTEVLRQQPDTKRRHTVKNHLDEMCREGLLFRDEKKYKLLSHS